MIYVETDSLEAKINLAFEEHFLKSGIVEEDLLLLWRNQPTVVVGAFQNTLEEVDMDYARRQGIAVVRRNSGGGAVYHDEGNLCFSFISRQTDFSNLNYKVFLDPVVRALSQMGMEAELSGRNDLTFQGSKISGSAVKLYQDRVLFHGTLLYDSDLEVLGKVLAVRSDKFTSKGVKSVRARVTTIRPHLPVQVDILTFKQTLLGQLFCGGPVSTYSPTPADLEAIHRLAEEKYDSYAWNFGRNPPCDMRLSKRFPGGRVTACLTLQKGCIDRCSFQGDFLGCTELETLEQSLQGVAYTEEAVRQALDGWDVSLYFGTITREELCQCLMG